MDDPGGWSIVLFFLGCIFGWLFRDFLYELAHPPTGEDEDG